MVGSAWRFRLVSETERQRPRHLLWGAVVLIGGTDLWLGVNQVASSLEGALISAKPLADGVRFLFGTLVAVLVSLFAITKWVPRPASLLFESEPLVEWMLVILVALPYIGALTLWYWTGWDWLGDTLVTAAYGAAAGLAGLLHVLTKEKGEANRSRGAA